MENKIKVFENRAVRTVWNAEEEEWYFSVVDVVAVLTDSDYQAARNYWKVLKNRLFKEGSELVTFCNRLKMQASDGKMRMTDCLDTKGILRLVQSIPSPKAEPFKVWLAEVGSDRLDEIEYPVALHVPNDETLSAMEEGQKILSDPDRKRYDDLAELFK